MTSSEPNSANSTKAEPDEPVAPTDNSRVFFHSEPRIERTLPNIMVDLFLLHQRDDLPEHFQARHTAAVTSKLDRISTELNALGENLCAGGIGARIAEILHIGLRRVDQAGNGRGGIIAAIE